MSQDAFLETRFEKLPSIVERRISGEIILVPVGRSASEMDSLYTLDEVGAYIWGLMDGQRTVREIKELILEEYDVSDEEAETDLIDFLRQLQMIGALRAM